MKTSFTWTKGLFSNLYQIFSNGEPIGFMEDKIFSKSANGSFNGKDYIFRTRGFLKQNTEIIDSSDNKVVGNIEYNNWMTKAEISVNSKRFKWKYDNIWNTQWSIFSSDGMIMKFKGSTTKGQIYSESDDGLLILTGLFVTNYYWQITLGILIPIFVVILI